MYYIVETEEQLNRLYCGGKECYLNIIPLNDQYHYSLNSPSLIYFKTLDCKGYIFPINHSEAYHLDFNKVIEWVDSKYDVIYTINKKECLYFFDNKKLMDISYKGSEYGSRLKDKMYDLYSTKPYINQLIPIGHHYNEQNQIFKDIEDQIILHTDYKTPHNEFYSNKFPQVFKSIEEQGLKVNPKLFDKHFDYNHKEWFLKDDVVYTKYNLYNLTTRPTNSFNNINFAALNKKDGSRSAFIPKNDYFFEFDYDSYHVRIVAKLIDYPLSRDSVHTQLGMQYFGVDSLTSDQYQQSKELTFKQLYGGVFKEYQNLPFFKSMTEYVNSLWDKFNTTEKLELIGGKVLEKHQIQKPTPNKILNYLIQSAETYYNVKAVDKLINYLKTKQSKVVLYTYDSFLVDFSSKDGKQILPEIKEILESEGFVIKVAYGKDYDSLKEI